MQCDTPLAISIHRVVRLEDIQVIQYLNSFLKFLFHGQEACMSDKAEAKAHFNQIKHEFKLISLKTKF